MKEKRKGPLSRAAGIAEGVAATVRRMQREREPRVLVYDPSGYARLVRELQTLQNRLYDCTKFEKLIRYRCANLFFIVLPEQLFRESEVPVGWGALVESNDTLTFVRKPIWHDATAASRIHVLHRIAVAGTRHLSRELSLDWHEQIVPGHFFWLRQAEQK